MRAKFESRKNDLPFFHPQSKGAPSYGLTLNLELSPFLLKGAIP